MDVHAFGGDDDYCSGVGYEVQGPSPHSSRQRPCRMHSRSGSSDLEGNSSETEVESLLSPSWPKFGEHQEHSVRRRHSRSRHRPSRRFVRSEGSSDSETNSEFDYPPRPNQRRNVTFTLSQSRARNSGSSPGLTTISGGTQSSVGGSQKVITDHRYRNNTCVHHGIQAQTTNYGFINITFHIHVGDFDSKIWVFSIGLFGCGDSMDYESTWLGLLAAHVLGFHRESCSLTQYFQKLVLD